MAHEHIKPHFMNITEDKLWGVYLCLSVKAHMHGPAGCLCVCALK